MKKISVLIGGRHATSVSLEEEFIDVLKEIAAERQKSINDIITEIDSGRTEKNLSSAIRIYILQALKNNI